MNKCSLHDVEQLQKEGLIKRYFWFDLNGQKWRKYVRIHNPGDEYGDFGTEVVYQHKVIPHDQFVKDSEAYHLETMDIIQTRAALIIDSIKEL